MAHEYEGNMVNEFYFCSCENSMAALNAKIQWTGLFPFRWNVLLFFFWKNFFICEKFFIMIVIVDKNKKQRDGNTQSCRTGVSLSGTLVHAGRSQSSVTPTGRHPEHGPLEETAGKSGGWWNLAHAPGNHHNAEPLTGSMTHKKSEASRFTGYEVTRIATDSSTSEYDAAQKYPWYFPRPEFGYMASGRINDQHRAGRPCNCVEIAWEQARKDTRRQNGRSVISHCPVHYQRLGPIRGCALVDGAFLC